MLLPATYRTPIVPLWIRGGDLAIAVKKAAVTGSMFLMRDTAASTFHQPLDCPCRRDTLSLAVSAIVLPHYPVEATHTSRWHAYERFAFLPKVNRSFHLAGVAQ